MPSSRRTPRRAGRHAGWSLFAVIAAVASGWSVTAAAQTAAQGFAVERLYRSAPGGGWIVMDDLSMHGGWGAAASVSTGYARDPLRVATADGSQRLAVLSDDAFAAIDLAVTYRRFRLSLELDSPILVHGDSGAGGATVGAYRFVSPSIDPGNNPDLVTDLRIGFDARLFGDADGPLRLGLSAQLYLPNGDASEERANYDSDGTFRGMLRALAAGDQGAFTYAAQVGVHIRPLDDGAVPGGPRGSELLFGGAAGAVVPVSGGEDRVVLGPEVYGASSFRSLFEAATTALEALWTVRFERTGEYAGPHLRVKAGAGAGLSEHFGAPEWRAVIALEMSHHEALQPTDPANR